MAVLVSRAHELQGVKIRSLGVWADYGLQTPEWVSSIQFVTSFGTPSTRESIADGIIEFAVTGFGDVFRDIDQQRPGSKPYDFTWFTVTPPNESGYCCVGGDLWDIRTSMQRSKASVAGVNRHLPRTYGDTWLHVSEIDYFYEQHEPFVDRMRVQPSAAAKMISEHVAGLVRSGDTLQIGMGSTAGALALLGTFDEKEDLGYFTELTVPGVTDLVRKGVITSKYATLHPNKFVAAGLTGTPDDYAYVDGNPFFEFRDYDYMLNPAVIGQNDNMVAINNALSVDLRGQVSVMSIGPHIFSGSGGQFSFHTGAYLSKGGRAITVLPSTNSDGTISRIVAGFPEGQIVTVPWDLADTVVTEFGVADLVGKSLRQRAEELIAIAHPDHRAALRRSLRTAGA